jgi:hypothetical protein
VADDLSLSTNRCFRLPRLTAHVSASAAHASSTANTPLMPCSSSSWSTSENFARNAELLAAADGQLLANAPVRDSGHEDRRLRRRAVGQDEREFEAVRHGADRRTDETRRACGTVSPRPLRTTQLTGPSTQTPPAALKRSRPRSGPDVWWAGARSRRHSLGRVVQSAFWSRARVSASSRGS